MRMTVSLALLALSTGACVMEDPESTAESDVTINPAKDGAEPAYVNGRQCTMVFPGALTSATQTYAIWAIGTHGIVYQGDDPAQYNTDQHPNLYAVFGTGAAASEVHHVDGFDAYDHYHILDAPAGAKKVKNKDWDLLVLVPGPNFDPATYHSARSVSELMAQSAAGILGPVSTPAIFGLPGLVLHSPILCPKQHDHGHGQPGHHCTEDDDDSGESVE